MKMRSQLSNRKSAAKHGLLIHSGNNSPRSSRRDTPDRMPQWPQVVFRKEIFCFLTIAISKVTMRKAPVSDHACT
jgi:hypothetical protein